MDDTLVQVSVNIARVRINRLGRVLEMSGGSPIIFPLLRFQAGTEIVCLDFDASIFGPLRVPNQSYVIT